MPVVAFGLKQFVRRQAMQGAAALPALAGSSSPSHGSATDTAGSAGQPAAKRAILLPSVRKEVQQLKAEIVELKAEVDKWKDLAQRHVADKAAHVNEIRKLRQEIDQLRAQATAVPDDD